ncbi:M23 family metallopeptidase [Massilia sp. PWRC2]|uniref:M23 family metallopeptidase n=1 Tax=Massilia sp. PWRC2 TaxID=2804626 RepID=UPI003CEE8584
MKWLLTLIFGAVLGAAGLFVYLRQAAHAPTATLVVPGTGGIVAPAAAPAPAPTSAAAIEPALPPAPVVPADLNELDLPLKPSAADSAALRTLAPMNGVKLRIPVDGVKYASLADTFNQPRGSERHHEALDIMAPTGSRVLAVADGKLVKLFNSKPGGLTIYQFDPTATWAYYYAHLDHYADGVKEGMLLKRGDLIGYVGVSGNADPKAPHLHFAVIELTPAKQWWTGSAINPYPLLAY